MKAKEYLVLYKSWQEDRPTQGSFYSNCPPEEENKPAADDMLRDQICNRMVIEFQEICKIRKITQPASVGSAIREQANKWKALCRRADDPAFIPEYFEIYVTSLAEVLANE